MKKKIILFFVCQISGIVYSSQANSLNQSCKDMSRSVIEVRENDDAFSGSREAPFCSILPKDRDGAFRIATEEIVKVDDPAFGPKRKSIVDPGAEERAPFSVEVNPEVASDLTVLNEKGEVFKRHAALDSSELAKVIASWKALAREEGLGE